MRVGPVLAITLAVGTAVGVASVQDIDIALSITLKCISILSFAVAFGYGIWKWRAEYKMQKTVDSVMEDYEEKKKQKRINTKKK